MQSDSNYNPRQWGHDKKGGFEISVSDLEKQKRAFKKRGGKINKLVSKIVKPNNPINSSMRNFDSTEL